MTLPYEKRSSGDRVYASIHFTNPEGAWNALQLSSSLLLDGCEIVVCTRSVFSPNLYLARANTCSPKVSYFALDMPEVADMMPQLEK